MAAYMLGSAFLYFLGFVFFGAGGSSAFFSSSCGGSCGSAATFLSSWRGNSLFASFELFSFPFSFFIFGLLASDFPTLDPMILWWM